MADLKITDLGAALSVGDSNVTVLDDGSSTMKVTMNQLKEYSIGTTDISGIGNGTATGAISSVNTSKNNVRDSIAPTETSTASRAYEVDEKMYISDVLYKATRNIALGDPLVSGTNITLANDVSTEIIELKSDASEAIDSVKNIIAPVEDGGTAVLSYSAGDQFIHLGALCKAKTTINAGDTFIINTNYEDAGQVVDQLDSVKQALADEVEARATLGAHQLIVYPYVNGNGHVSGNVTFTVDDDGIITATSTGTPNGWFNCMSLKAISETSFKIGKTYTLSGGESGITLYVDIRNSSNTSVLSKNTSGTPVDFTIPNDAAYISVFINVDTAVSSKKIKPLITDVSDTNREFTPYAMTNFNITNIINMLFGSNISKFQFAYLDSSKTTSANKCFEDLVSSLGTLSENTVFVGLHERGGVRCFIAYLYANKLYGACIAFGFTEADIAFTYLNNGTYTRKQIQLVTT